MKIVVAPDSFKGSISGQEFCSAVIEGIHRVLPSADIVEIPLSDGGEGTSHQLIHATNGKLHKINVLDPLHRPITAFYGVLGDQETVIIEVAQASGLILLTESERNPRIATSYGTGELIKEALNQGYRKFIIGLGGSATNDGGVGMLKALGFRFYDQNGKDLENDVLSLMNLDHIDETNAVQGLQESTFLVATDVNNPLTGDKGASYVFGPQKGATPDQVEELDQALFHYAQMVKKQKGVDVNDIPGSGAAGGLGSAFLAFFNTSIRPGINIVMETLNFEESLLNTDLLITGEGRLDQQTLGGKVISGVCQAAKAQKVPVIALCGSIELNSEKMNELGILAGFSIVPGPCTLVESMDKGYQWITDRTEQIFRVINKL